MKLAARPSKPKRSSDAGRMCPVDYRYAPSVFAREPDLTADVLYVVGGLYGNPAALEEVERLASDEAGPVTIVFNGDFHWFDADPDWFAAIDHAVARHQALRGNVETEIVRDDDIGAGCGCAYPESVDDGVVQRSNLILAELKQSAQASPAALERCPALPMHLVATVGPLRVGIVHGDAGSLAGWAFAHDLLDAPDQLGWLAEVRRQSRVDVFASTHTCLAALRHFSLPSGAMTVINNGAAGMPNFAGTQFGLLSRIATRSSPHPAVYGTIRDGVHIDAVAIRYDQAAFLKRFLARWPQGSPAHLSYHRRIMSGPDYAIDQASGHLARHFSLAHTSA
jgi:hypothetical protein